MTSQHSLPAERLSLPAIGELPLKAAHLVLSRLTYWHRLTDMLGFHLRHIHYYEPLPDFGQIDRAKLLERRLSPAIDWRFDEMIALTSELSTYRPEIAALELDGFGELDAAVYYSLLRKLGPRRVIEIGSGHSTRVAYHALERNAREGRPGEMTCIEPFPSAILTKGGLPIELVRENVENVDLGVFRSLRAGDVLFIDSTHTVKYNSDVCREVLEIMPILASGVYVHFHDIFFPYDYPPEWLLERRTAWNEQYMIEAFMAYNSGFEVVYANHLMSVDHPEIAAQLWPEVTSWPRPNHRCGSFWIRKR